MQASFRRLQVWNRAKALAVRIYDITTEGRIARDWGMRDQMRRASVSVASNIAEGNERGTDRDACRYFYIAKGSAGELLTQIEIAAEVGLMQKEEAESLSGECEQISRMIRALIDYRERASGLPSRPSSLAPRY